MGGWAEPAHITTGDGVLRKSGFARAMQLCTVLVTFAMHFLFLFFVNLPVLYYKTPNFHVFINVTPIIKKTVMRKLLKKKQKY